MLLITDEKTSMILELAKVCKQIFCKSSLEGIYMQLSLYIEAFLIGHLINCGSLLWFLQMSR